MTAYRITAPQNIHTEINNLAHISLKFVLKGPTDNTPALVQVMAWHRIADKPLPETSMTQIIDAYVRH